jgi:hypothetical protein
MTRGASAWSWTDRKAEGATPLLKTIIAQASQPEAQLPAGFLLGKIRSSVGNLYPFFYYRKKDYITEL